MSKDYNLYASPNNYAKVEEYINQVVNTEVKKENRACQQVVSRKMYRLQNMGNGIVLNDGHTEFFESLIKQMSDLLNEAVEEMEIRNETDYE